MQFKYSLGVISLCSALFLVGCNDDNSSASQTPTVQEQKQKEIQRVSVERPEINVQPIPQVGFLAV